MPGTANVTVAIPTFRRPHGLERAIASARSRLAESDMGSRVCEVIVIDNDTDPSAAQVVADADWNALRYVHEPVPGVANARNRALDEAQGDFLLFFDDDECVGPGWPDGLLDVMHRTGAGLVGGPVRSRFTSPPPDWVDQLGLFVRDDHADGAELSWLRSGNLAIDLDKINGLGLRFDPAFNGGGEDVRFSTVASRAGVDLRWAASAVVYEDVASDRLNEAWVFERAENAMANYLRARDPLPLGQLVRTSIVAGGRLVVGSIVMLVGRGTGRSPLRVRGGVWASQGRGAIRALWTTVRGPAAKRSRDSITRQRIQGSR